MLLTIFRRTLGIALFVITCASAAAQGQEIKVTLLGTGCPATQLDTTRLRLFKAALPRVPGGPSSPSTREGCTRIGADERWHENTARTAGAAPIPSEIR
jgi:hypothetical protein